jgi:hypothetical protein
MFERSLSSNIEQGTAFKAPLRTEYEMDSLEEFLFSKAGQTGAMLHSVPAPVAKRT